VRVDIPPSCSSGLLAAPPSREKTTTSGDQARTPASLLQSGRGVNSFEGLGIISRKISTRTDGESEPKDIAKYFVPASTIAKFIPAEYRL
jgi:hypothetical protein